MLKHSPTNWRKISVAIVLLVMVRGIFLLCVLPPFEGWDEYQHIAYIVYLRENHSLPHLGVSTVPESMTKMLQKYPHPQEDQEQTGPAGWGTKTYDTFWTSTASSEAEIVKPVTLYEAQHPPLYYLLALPFWVAFSHISDLAGITVLRLENLFFAAVAIFIFLRTLEISAVRTRHKILIGLLVGSYPLYLVTATRIANDSLSLLFGSLTLYLTIKAIKEKPIVFFALASCSLALGILTKGTMMTMVPVVMTGIIVCFYRRKITIPTAIKAGAMLGLVLILFLGPLYYYNYKTTGGFYLMAQHLELRNQGKSTFWVFASFFKIDWISQLRDWLFVRTIWVSGWSFILPQRWIWFPYKAILLVFWFSVVGKGLWRGWSRNFPATRPEYLFADNSDLLVFASVLLCMTAGLGYFAITGMANWGKVLIVPSYFMIAVPVWSTLLYQAALFIKTRFAFWFAHVLLAFYVISEVVGVVYSMPRAFTSTTWSSETWIRLNYLHPAFPGPWLIVPSMVLIAGLLTYLVKIAWQTNLEAQLDSPRA